jgi:hypothetical protein
MKRYFNAPLTAGILLALAVPLAAHAESSRNNGAGAVSTDARVDFRVNIPQFVSLRVGSPAATIDQVVFDVAEADLGNGTDVAATSGGDVGAGVLTAQVLSNGGDVTLDANSDGPLTNGTETIPWSEILATSNDTALPVPAVDGATTTVLAGTNGVANEMADWTFSYSNSAIVEAGQYDGRVTYTASVL